MRRSKLHRVVLAKAVKQERASSMLLACVTVLPCKARLPPYSDTGE